MEEKFQKLREKRIRQAQIAKTLTQNAYLLARSEAERYRNRSKVELHDVLGVSFQAFVQGIRGQDEQEREKLTTLLNSKKVNHYASLDGELMSRFCDRKLTEAEFRYVENLVPLMKEIDNLNGFQVKSGLEGYRGYDHIESMSRVTPLQNLPAGTRKITPGMPAL